MLSSPTLSNEVRNTNSWLGNSGLPWNSFPGSETITNEVVRGQMLPRIKWMVRPLSSFFFFTAELMRIRSRTRRWIFVVRKIVGFGFRSFRGNIIVGSVEMFIALIIPRDKRSSFPLLLPPPPPPTMSDQARNPVRRCPSMKVRRVDLSLRNCRHSIFPDWQSLPISQSFQGGLVPVSPLEEEVLAQTRVVLEILHG